MTIYTEDFLVNPSFLCEADRGEGRNALSVICCGTVKIDTVWRDGCERWSVSALRDGQWEETASGSSGHCATAWIEACKSAYSVYVSRESGVVEDELRNFMPWMRRNGVDLAPSL